MKKQQKYKNRSVLIMLCSIVILCCVAVIYYFALPDPLPASEPIPEDCKLELHFIDVAQGDSTLILCGGEAMLVDGGEPSRSRTIYNYLSDHGIEHLKYIVSTHPDSDHTGGLAAALNYASCDEGIANTEYDESKVFNTFRRVLDEKGVPFRTVRAGDTLKLGPAEISVLAPGDKLEQENDNSIVLRIVFGSSSFLLTGDAGFEEEQQLLKSGAELQSSLLKVAHHGSSGSCSSEFIAAVRPTYAVISVGADNYYQHPSQNTLDILNDIGAVLYRTDLQGTIIAVSDGTGISFSTEYDCSAGLFTGPGERSLPIAPEEAESADYILNIKSMKFHYPDCKGVKSMSAQNAQAFTGSREELIALGYIPCGTCKP